MMNKSVVIRVLLLIICAGVVPNVWAQSDDFTTWTKFKVSHKIDSRFSVSGNLELRTEDDMNMIDRWGIAVGGSYRMASFAKLDLGYEAHYRNLGESEWKFRHRYHLGITAEFRYQWLKLTLRERFQQTFDRGDSKTRLRSRLKCAYLPQSEIVSPYFSIELYQSLGNASFWRAARMRYRCGAEFSLAEQWDLDTFYCYQYESSAGKHIVGIEVGFSF